MVLNPLKEYNILLGAMYQQYMAWKRRPWPWTSHSLLAGHVPHPNSLLGVSRSCPQSLSCSEKGEDRVERALGQNSGQEVLDKVIQAQFCPFHLCPASKSLIFSPTLTQGLGPELQDKELRIEQTMPGMRGSGDRHVLSKSAGSHEVCGSKLPTANSLRPFPGRSLCTREWFPMCQ